MPTQKELMAALRDELRYLKASVLENAKRYSQPVQLETSELAYLLQDSASAVRGHEKAMADVVDKFAESLQIGIKDLFGELLIGGLIGGGIALLLNHLKMMNQKISMIKSIQFLQTEHPYLTYDFIVERSSANRANKEDRQTILNELIQDGIVTSYQYDDKKAYEIKPDNPKLSAFWEKAKGFELDLSEKLEKT